MKRKILRTVAILAILISNIGCDQISKNIVRKNIEYNEHISVVNNYLILTKIENKGAFLSLGDSLPQILRILILTILPLIILTVVLLYLFTKKNLSRPTVTGICFMIGGGVGNIYDRILYGSVTDFLHIDFIIFQTGIFNLADVSVMIGLFIVCFEFYLKKLRSSKYAR